MERAALAVEALSGVSVDGPALLTERAELLGLPEPTTVSANGTCRMLPVADG